MTVMFDKAYMEDGNKNSNTNWQKKKILVLNQGDNRGKNKLWKE